MLMCSWTFRLRTDPIDAAAAGILLDRAAVVRMREVATLLNMMDEWMDEWMDEYMDVWMGCVSFLLVLCSRYI